MVSRLIAVRDYNDFEIYLQLENELIWGGRLELFLLLAMIPLGTQ